MAGIESDSAKSGPRWGIPILLALLVAATVLRLPGCFNDFWLDEIWTLDILNRLDGFTDIFTSFDHSNNHHLNTMIFYLLGNCDHWAWYRVHSMLAGIGTIVLAWLLASRAGRAEAILSVLLLSGSYLMIHFSSEARGYSLVIFFAFSAFYAALRIAERRGGWLWIVVIWISAILGFLAHLIYLHAFVALAVWLFIRFMKEERSLIKAARRAAVCLGVPAFFFGWFFLFVVREMTIGGATGIGLQEVIVKTLSYTGGGPAEGLPAIWIAAATGGILLWALVRLRQQKNSEWIFHLIVIVLSPALVIAVEKPEELFVRYFLVGTAFGLLAAAYLLADLFRRGGRSRLLAVVLVALYLAGNGINVANFYEHGRGGYQEGLQYMVDHTKGEVITLTNDQKLRNKMPVDYYARFLDQERRIEYFDFRSCPPQGAMWMILHKVGRPDKIRQRMSSRFGPASYKLVKHLPYSDLSGYHWFIYQNQFLLERGLTR